MERGLSAGLTCRLLATGAAALLSACSGDPSPQSLTGVSRATFSESEYGVSSSPRVASNDVPKGGGSFKLGAPYKVAGRWYVPRDNPGYDEYGVASWYGADFHGRRTANGEVFDANALTAAHPTLPLPCYVYVTNVDNGRTILVRVNDRGPYVNDRLIDMSYAAAKQLGYVSKGRARVRVRYAGLAPLNGDDRRERQYLASQQYQQQYQQQDRGWNQSPQPARQYASAEEQTSGFAPDASDRWDANAYRASLAGKPVPQPPAAARRSRTFVQTASLGDPDAGSGRMALAAPQDQTDTQTEAFDAQPFAPARPYNGEQSYERQSTSSYSQGSGRAYVQVGIFRDRSNAERLRRELGSLGPVEVAPVQVESGAQGYRVRVGPFSQSEVSRAQGRIATYGVANTAIVFD
ncbi:septal ring lytic transglycosylase RlpA family protein [Hyphomicrobium sp.]|uniref:septal ring lytic transglycosylase RlpA family protein n=1 Tax=Hyphomicrobium sp. TaxID=82 RepID=UPI000F993389|nr:septal ring lytic transglycosylase RlpA family protein [Hyphomicrobium sp.]RUO98812.1 MAG: septal ring lytic transglycosylase RlpA family protein [Hyphomicrobium sp.]